MNTEIELVKENQQIEIYQSDKEMITTSCYDPDTKAVMLRAIAVRFFDLPMAQRVEVITTELEQAYIRNGTEKDNDEIKAFTIAEVVDLFNQRKQITHKEVTHIFKNGSLGLYGKNYGINIKSINDWILAFYEDETRKIAVRKLNDLKKKTTELKELTPAESETLMVKMVKEIYYQRIDQRFENTEMLSHPLYDILKDKGLLNLTIEQKKGYMEEAEELLTSAKYQSESESIIGKQLNYAMLQTDATKVAKVLAVRDYFNDLTSRNVELPL